jgi:hypothetical protein
MSNITEIKLQIVGSFPLTEYEMDCLIVPVSFGISPVADYTVQSPIIWSVVSNKFR